MSAINLQEQIACLTTEWRRRKRIYPALIESGRMGADEAAAEIARMDAARQTLTQLLGMLDPK